MEIKVDNLTNSAVKQLLGEHINSMSQQSPPESKYALDLEGLKKPDITFWSAWENHELLGFGALHEIDPQHGELKSLKTSPVHLKKGVAAKMVDHIIKEATSRGYNRISLETGPTEIFGPAINLYKKFGFEYCEPFASYKRSDFNIFMTLKL
ncbi:GNAT family N-acetyltransferase [Planococcus halotolerans]|uniref:GNAT family N-acetyltransferase n=1 Tax=Planococcus halotolerans TaxID=2233542 RepID=A0A365L0G6_9BACL|nr:GNAT family N-acetyltransferase [Planococcus halotolerans]QHJ71321.1 GNAT family N-acetyltransferase [Planococcus halotolerans]RAZ78918.1 GNAT family N-acetyltransferase [Planococcus halotolerans]